ncbi:MAG TPA: DpnI domain-containing protein [Candidatus Acidoferrales bacterium]|nr:DpnI domain-containing protein [Candidatus Acidoferrales bacterium]
MQLRLPTSGLDRYKSASQRARVATEEWATNNLYCITCRSDALAPSPPGTRVIDYVCPRCDSRYQLKSQSHFFRTRVLDSDYATMLRAIQTGSAPHLMVLQYEREAWAVVNLLFVPRFAFTRTVLEKRKALGPHARRAGWIGCNFLLDKIPLDARISVIHDGVALQAATVRRQFERLKPLAELKLEKRGWTLDTLNFIRSLGKQEFNLSDIYALEDQFKSLHPDNRHIRDKIRQQLQVLRDLRLLQFLRPGHYRLL